MLREARSAILCLSLAILPDCGFRPPPSSPRDATEVVVDRPRVSQVTDYEEFTGHTEAIRSVQIRSRVSGYLLEKAFVEGSEVKEGDLLYVIDDRIYRTALDAAQAEVDQGFAHRSRLEADARRAAQLFRRGAIGRAEFDLVSSDFAEADASLSAARARLDAARLNLSFARIRAPMDGQISRSLVDPGNLVRQEVTPLTDIIVADRLYVYFDINGDTMSRVTGLLNDGRIHAVDGKNDVPVLVGLPDDEGFPYRGTVNFLENKLDPATGTLRIRGVIENPRPWILSPGLFVEVRLPIGVPYPGLLVPEEAVGSDQGRRFVYVVDRSDEVIYRPVEIGPVFEGMRSITRGLAPDDRVIVTGLQRVRPGSKVAPRSRQAGVAGEAKDPVASL